MSLKKVLGGCLSVALLCGALAARGAVAVGDKPTLEFVSATGGGPQSLTKYKGKIIVVDFWATWCGPCMAEADHMVKINTDLAPKGLQMIGVSLDSSVPNMKTVSATKGFNWPQMCDAGGWGSRPAKEWGVNSIPRTFIIGPEGDVLWTGHPGNIDAALADAFKKHPPQLVEPKVLAEATAIVDKVEGALKDGGQASAVKMLAAFPAAARADGKLAERLGEVEKKLEDYANKSLAEIDPLIQNKQYVEATTRLNDLARSLGSLPSGVAAKKRLNEVLANPEAKAQFEAQQKAKAADDELAIAKRLQGEGKDEQAYLKYKAVAANYAGMPAADGAKAALAAYEKNPELVQKANDSAAAGKAKGMMGMAANYQKAGRAELAKKKYQEIIAAFPGSSFAKQAQAAIEAIDEAAPK